MRSSMAQIESSPSGYLTRRTWRSHAIKAAMLACALLPLAGCGRSNGPSLGQVKGTVLLNGRPLASADIVFRPVKGHVSYGTTDANGHYDLVYLRDRGAVVGTHKVQIFPGKTAKEKVPDCYNTKSTLQKEVVAGKNEINFDLK
jgi:hypothetical protein